jgi:hypothetical protein
MYNMHVAFFLTSRQAIHTILHIVTYTLQRYPAHSCPVFLIFYHSCHVYIIPFSLAFPANNFLCTFHRTFHTYHTLTSVTFSLKMNHVRLHISIAFLNIPQHCSLHSIELFLKFYHIVPFIPSRYFYKRFRRIIYYIQLHCFFHYVITMDFGINYFVNLFHFQQLPHLC